jgi:hypothetical protein
MVRCAHLENNECKLKRDAAKEKKNKKAKVRVKVQAKAKTRTIV